MCRLSAKQQYNCAWFFFTLLKQKNCRLLPKEQQNINIEKKSVEFLGSLGGGGLLLSNKLIPIDVKCYNMT